VQLAEGDLWMKELIARHKPEERPKVAVGPEDVALFQYSGGTTGISIGAVALHRNLVANSLQIRRWMTAAEDGKEVVLMAIPLFRVWYGRRDELCDGGRRVDGDGA
jgi:long-chain acyl-CoA synthetase